MQRLLAWKQLVNPEQERSIKSQILQNSGYGGNTYSCLLFFIAIHQKCVSFSMFVSRSRRYCFLYTSASLNWGIRQIRSSKRSSLYVHLLTKLVPFLYASSVAFYFKTWPSQRKNLLVWHHLLENWVYVLSTWSRKSCMRLGSSLNMGPPSEGIKNLIFRTLDENVR